MDMNRHWIGYGLALVAGLILGWGLTSIDGGEAGAAEAGGDPGYSAQRLKRDNESLRRHVAQLESQLATWENAHDQLNTRLQETEQSAASAAPLERYAENPGELGAFIGTLRSQWDEFRRTYGEQRPAPGDPGYADYLARFQQIVSQSAVLGAQLSTLRTYEPAEFASFHSQLAASYLGLNPQDSQKIQPVVQDLIVQLNEQGLGRDSFPEDRTKIREWIQNRNQFERQSTEIVAQLLPPDRREAYIQAFNDDIFESGIRDMMRDIYRFMR